MSGTSESVLEEIWGSFAETQNVFFASSEGDQPRVRPVTLIQLEKRLFVATGSSDAKVGQIRANPKTEFCLLLEKHDRKGSLRTECTATIVKDKALRARVYRTIPFLKEFWETPEDLGYTLLELQPTSFEYMRPESMEAIKAYP